MNTSEHNKLAREVWVQALMPTPSDDAVDPGDLIERWLQGGHSPEEREALLRQISENNEARSMLVDLARIGKASFPVIPEQEAEEETKPDSYTVPASPVPRPSSGKRFLFWAGLTTAAVGLLIAVVVLIGEDSQQAAQESWNLAKAASELGDHKRAFRELETLIDQKSLTAEMKADVKTLYEESGYQYARQLLLSGSHKAAVEVIETVMQSTPGSGRLAALRLSARGGHSQELALMEHPWFDAKDGNTKGTGEPSSAATPRKKLLQDYQQALKKYPEEVPLLVNYGHLLIQEDRPLEAVEFFQRARKVDANHAWAKLGHALALTIGAEEHAEDEAALENLNEAVRILQQLHKAEPAGSTPELQFSVLVCLAETYERMTRFETESGPSQRELLSLAKDAWMQAGKYAPSAHKAAILQRQGWIEDHLQEL